MESQTQHVEEHIQKAEHNAKHLKYVMMNVQAFPDWAVTVAFYVAVHYVEAFLTKVGHPQDQHHPERNKIIATAPEPELTGIARRYLALYNRSRFSRYWPTSQRFIRPDEASKFVADACELIPKALGFVD
jgi:hypothetical protein